MLALVVAAAEAEVELERVLLAELVLLTAAGIFVGSNVPHVLQDRDPGLS